MSYLDDEYWRVNHAVMSFAIDAQTAVIGGTEESGAVITEDVFLDHIYAPRLGEQFEQNIADRLLSARALICIAGPRGCGKTSAIRYATRLINSSHPDVRVVLVDVKRIWDQRALRDLTGDIGTPLRMAMRQALQAELFPRPLDTRQLAAWLLAGAPDESDAFDPVVLMDLHELSAVTMAEAAIDDDQRAGRVLALARYFATERQAFPHALKALYRSLRAAHVVQAFVKLKPTWRRLIVIYDNVDRMPSSVQPKFLELANDKQLSLGGLCSTAVVLRKENLRGEIARQNEKGELFENVELQDMEYPKALLPSISPEHVRNVLERRHAYADALARTTGAARPQDQSLHTAVVGEFLDHSIGRLANDSLRMINAIYSGFIRYLLLLRDRGLITAEAHWRRLFVREDGHLQTLFFLWLREKGPEYDIVLYDVLRMESESNGESFAAAASVHHLLITTTLNLSSRTPSNVLHRYPPFSDVCEQLVDVGFSFREIKRALGDLVAPHGEQLRSLEFFASDITVDAVEETSRDRLRLTPLGHEATTNIFHKVGYVWGSAYGTSQEKDLYLQLSVSARMLIFYDYVVKMAERHLKLMAMLRSHWYLKYGDQWLDEYRARFGVKTKTQVERILESSIGFYRRQFVSADVNVFRVLLEGYHALLQRVSIGTPFNELQLHELTRGRATLADAAHRTKQKTQQPEGGGARASSPSPRLRGEGQT
jgi:hypothetical protein